MRRAVIACTALLGTLLIVLGLGATGASAQGELLRGTIRDSKGQPAPNVQITAATAAGRPVDSVRTDASGRWQIMLPGPGTYRVTLRLSTLPAGETLRLPGDRGIRTIRVTEGEQRPVAFLLGPRNPGTGGAAEQPGAFDRVAQLLFDGLNFGLIIALAALGLSLVFGTTGLTNFSHGELVTMGAFLTLVLSSNLDLPFPLAAAVAVFGCGLFGFLQDRFFWGPIHKRGVGLIVMMIISIGLAMFLRHVYLFFFGGGNRSFGAYTGQAGWQLGPISATPKSLVGMAVAVGVLVVVGLCLLLTRLGKATRAVADNPTLAESSGINVELVTRMVWTVGTAIAGLAGVIFGLSFGLNYQMGFATLLIMFAGVTLGGLGTAFGALVGSLVVGVFIQLSTLVIPAELKNAGALAVLIIVLLFRPQGILGRRERIG